MLSARLALIAAIGATSLTGADPLKVLRVSPQTAGEATEDVTVTFDRPVAGGLDSTVDPKTIFTITPRVAGRLEWRDPVTIRLHPAAALPAGARFTVRIANSFHAMDGSRLAAPYTFSFRVRGPKVLDAFPVNQWSSPQYLTPDTHFTLLVSGPVNLSLLAPLVSIDVGKCVPGKTIPLRPVRQRRIGAADERWRYFGDYTGGDSTRDLRRVVELTSAEPLPSNCAATLNVPERVDSVTTNRTWAFHTYGPFAVDSLTCGYSTGRCPIGPAHLYFSTPVKGGEVLRHVHLAPALTFSVSDTAAQDADWNLEAQLTPRTRYLVTVDSGLADVFGQRLGAPFSKSVATTSYTPQIRYPYGRMVVERTGPRTLAVEHVNVDSLVVTIVGVPDSLEPRILGNEGGWGDVWEKLKTQATTQTVAVPGRRDLPSVSAMRIPAINATRGGGTLQMIRVSSPAVDTVPDRPNLVPTAVIQLTDLAVHARIGAQEGDVWVTGVSDGNPRSGARVTLYDTNGKVRARATTDARGLARLTGYAGDTAATQEGDDEGECEDCDYSGVEGYVAATLGTDRAVVNISRYDADLSPWQFNVSAAYGSDRLEQASAVFTERGIYRPGEPVYAKAIVRDGLLGNLRVPRTDSLRWVFTDRENAIVKDTTVGMSPFGTSDQSFTIPTEAPLGSYTVRVDRRRDGKWHSVATTDYKVAEYRPPEFLLNVATDRAPHFTGDSVRATVEASYLFGAPMGRAALTWYARQRTASPWEFEIPNTEGYTVGETGWWWEEMQEENSGGQGGVIANGTDTLDATGHIVLRAAAPTPPKGRAAWISFEATVTDVNRQTVTAQASVLMHPASFYLGAKSDGSDYFWTAGKPRSVSLIAVTPQGTHVSGVAIRGTLIRREWHRTTLERDGTTEDVGEWVADTVDRCSVTSADAPVACRFTPSDGGSYTVRFQAADEKNRPVATSFYRWVVGKDWVPWNDDSKFKMDVVPDRTRYAVGDTATVLFAAPFTNAEAWITVEREGVIDERRLRITSGTTILKLPITEAYVPNAFVSIVVARGRSAPPKAPDDPGRPTIRVGYAELRVTPATKRLTVEVKALATEYRPGDSARVDVRVRDAAGKGRKSEVTLWAVDEGVLSLTGYRTPDPVDLIYRPRGLGMRLASNLTSVAAQVTEGEKGQRAPGGGGGMDVEGVLRSRFQTTAFFLGSVVTDSGGHAVAAAKLPDNLTTFRLMAVAVTAGDRYGAGDAKLLVTRPLVARPALPRFVREGDSLLAGVVVNSRLSGTPTVTVQARTQGALLVGPDSKTATLEAGRGREVRFTFRGSPGDTATFRFKATSGADADAVETRLPIRLPYHPRAFEVAGTLVDTASAEFVFDEPIDPARSRLVLSYGASPLALIRGYRETLRVYPYYCSEQVASVALPLITLYKAQRQLGRPLVTGDPQVDIAAAVSILVGRQRDDGAIGLWSKTDWSTPWISADAGRVLLAARTAGIAVSDSALQRLVTYLSGSLHNPAKLYVPVFHWYDDEKVKLGERVAAADFLSRAGSPDIPAENDLLQRVRSLSWEDRALLAEMLARRRELVAARSLLAPTWAQIRIEGRRAVLPADASAKYFYFGSQVRPAARLLMATLAVEPGNALVGPLVETVAQRGRAQGDWWWDTQDYAAAVEALARYDTYRRQGADRPVRITRGARVLFEKAAGGTFSDTTIALTGLVANRPDGKQALQVSLGAQGSGSPVFFYLTVRAVPQARPVSPADAGIKVERWYERYDRPVPITRAVEGDLIRVKLRVTVASLRNFIVVDDALPAGIEAVDLSLRTAGLPPVAPQENPDEEQQEVTGDEGTGWYYGYWESGWWSPWDHRELRDDRVVYVATTLWPGTYTMTYVARATTPGVFVRPPVHAEEMYNPGVNGRSDGGVFTVSTKRP